MPSIQCANINTLCKDEESAEEIVSLIQNETKCCKVIMRKIHSEKVIPVKIIVRKFTVRKVNLCKIIVTVRENS